MSVLSLPCELLVQIFKQLDVQTAHACKRVNRLFHKIFQDSIVLQYALECRIAGVDNNPYCTLSISTRLQMLRNRESAWSSFIPRLTISGCVPWETSSMLDMSCGLFVVGLAGEPPNPQEVGGGVQTYPITQGDLVQDGSSWSVFEVKGVLGFATCLYEHDLLVFLVIENISPELFELRLSLISHSLNSPHPLAQESKIPVCRTSTPDSVVSYMNVAGENLAVCVESGHNDCKLYIFNWQTGNLKAPPFPDVNDVDLVFLRHDLLLHPSLEGRCFNIYHIPPTTEGGDVKLIQRLSFPAQFSYSFLTVEAQGAPNVTDNDSFPKYVSSERPFLDRPQDAILVFNFNPMLEIPSVSMIVHRKSLIELLPPQSEWSQIGTSVALEWEQWGPEITRWLRVDPDPVDSWTTPPYGQRYFRAGPTSMVLDFNRYHFRNADYEDDIKRLAPIDGSIPGCLPFTLRSSTLYQDYDQPHTAVSLSPTGLASIHWDEEGLDGMTLYRVSHFG